MQRSFALLIAALLTCSVLPAAAAASASQAPPVAPAAAADGVGTIPVEDCWGIGQPGEGRQVDCLFVEVPLDHSEPDGERIRVATTIVRAVSDDPGEPVIILGGGPGEAIVGLLTPLVAMAPELIVDIAPVDRDLVLIDQRGVGLSEPALDCPEVDAIQPISPAGLLPPTVDLERLAETERAWARADENPFRAAFETCYERLSAEVDLAAFTTAQNAADLDLVRRAVAGDGQVALYGTSYGARLALRAQEAHPDAWSAVVLASPVPGEANFVEDIAANYQDTLERLEAACVADATGCARAFPDLLEDLDRGVRRLAQRPSTVQIPTPEGPFGLTIDASLFANLLFQSFYLPPRAVPAVIDALGEGRDQAVLFGLADPGPRADAAPMDLLALQPDPDEQPPPEDEPIAAGSSGMQRSFVCAEEFAYADLEQQAADAAAAAPVVQAFMASPFFGSFDPALCEVWPVPPADPSTFDPVESDIPTLVFTGGLDQITPPSYGDRTMAGLSRGILVNAPDQGHSPAFSLAECGARVIGAFLADPTGDLDASCAEERPVRFDTVLSDAPALGVARVAGAERYATAARLSGWTFAPGVEVAFLATGRDFADGLAAGAAGALRDAPVLLTDPVGLPQQTADELARLRPQEVVIVGGEGAVSAAVASAAGAAADAPVRRAAGSDRYATAAALSRAVHPEGASTVFLATGQAFPDGLTAAPVAGVEGAPLLLTGTRILPQATSEELARLAPDEVVIVGGAGAVSAGVAAELQAMGLAVSRLSGPDRFGTALALAERIDAGTGWAFTTTGMDFADALAGAPVAAGRGPLLLVRPDDVPVSTAAALDALQPSQIGVFGGTAAVSDPTAIELGGFLAGPAIDF